MLSSGAAAGKDIYNPPVFKTLTAFHFDNTDLTNKVLRLTWAKQNMEICTPHQVLSVFLFSHAFAPAVQLHKSLTVTYSKMFSGQECEFDRTCRLWVGEHKLKSKQQKNTNVKLSARNKS